MKKKTKINIVLPEVVRSARGGHKVVYEYSNYLVSHGYNVNLYFFPGNMLQKIRIPSRIRFFLVKMYGEIIGPKKWFKLDGRIKKHVIKDISEVRHGDIIIATGVETANPVFSLDDTHGKKMYLIQDFENWYYDNKYVENTYALGMKNIVVSKWLKEVVDSVSGKPSMLLSNCIDSGVFKDKKCERHEHSIVFHFRSASHKGCEYAFRVVDELIKQYPDLRVDVISSEKPPVDLPFYCLYHRNINAEKISDINNLSKVFMCTSIDEGFGLPGLEAMACGCAVVSTRYRGVLEYAIDGENALLSEPRDVDAMVNNIVRLFEDDELRNRIAENGVKTGKERSLEKSAQKFEEVLINSIKRG